MKIKCDRLGKIAIMTSLTNEDEEVAMKSYVKNNHPDIKLAVTFISGLSHEIKGTFIRSIVTCALQNNIILKEGTTIHALVHASIDAMTGIMHSTPAEGSLKLKVAVASDADWIAVAVYGDSAFYPLTNHERASLGMMHL